MTTITESFPGSSDTLGGDQTWTEIAGDWDNVSGVCEIQNFFAAMARCETALASDDHYAQVVAVNPESLDTNTALRVTCRHSNAADTYYHLVFGHNRTWQIRKVVAGVDTFIGNLVLTTCPNNSVVKLEVDGSNLKGYKDGVQVGSTQTDASITGNTRCGLYASTAFSTTKVRYDNFQASDLGAADSVLLPFMMHMSG